MKLYRQVSTSERMPDKDGNYFVFTDEGKYIGVLKYEKQSGWHNGLTYSEVTGWLEQFEQ